jgi:hypothetical protein
MSTTPRFSTGTAVLMEMMEFASFPKGTERYIRRSLDIGLSRRDAVSWWSRNEAEAVLIRAQLEAYRRLDEIRDLIPGESRVQRTPALMVPLVEVSAFDLCHGWLIGFPAYRFLYERLLGAAIRPWLPAAFSAAAMLPQIQPEDRLVLLRSLGEETIACTAWSPREPMFIPEWVEKVENVIDA